MLRSIRKAFFSGWKTEKLSRVSALCYQFLIVLFQLVVTALTVKITSTSVTEVIPAWLVLSILLLLAVFLLISVYCCMLIMTKRMRDLGIKYPICLTILTYIANIGAFRMMSIVPESFKQSNQLNTLLYIAVSVIALWNLYVISGKSR
jgi:hypothetical protein